MLFDFLITYITTFRHLHFHRYGKDQSEIVTETSPVGDDSSPRVARLLAAERAALDAGGCVLRLAGLYDLQRGAHNYWLTKAAEIAGGPDGLINLLHYDDAAGACLAALLADKNTVERRVFLISDGNPLSRRAICESTMKAAVYREQTMPRFAPNDGSKGKVYDGSWSNAQLQWKPKYESFDRFMSSHA
jgi:nucleoside-diphosphate-sugar epimerase